MFPMTCNTFGDIFTAPQLVLEIAKALNDSRGALCEYHNLIVELRSLSNAFNFAGCAIQLLTFDSIIFSAVHAEIGRCHTTMDEPDYDPAFPTSISNVGPSLFSFFNSDLNPISYRLSTDKGFSEVNQDLTVLKTLAQEIRTLVVQLSRSIYPSEGNSIKVIIPLGRTMDVPTLLCTTREVDFSI